MRHRQFLPRMFQMNVHHIKLYNIAKSFFKTFTVHLVTRYDYVAICYRNHVTIEAIHSSFYLEVIILPQCYWKSGLKCMDPCGSSEMYGPSGSSGTRILCGKTIQAESSEKLSLTRIVIFELYSIARS